MQRTLVVAQGGDTELKAEVAVKPTCCPTCGQKRLGGTLERYYRQLGEEAAAVLYAGTPGGFWQAIENFAVVQALKKGTVVRPPTAKDITDQW